MKANWLRGFRGAVLMALAWAAAWAPVAVLVGLAIDPDGSMDEMWPAIGAYPGFLCAVVLALVLAVAERGRRLDELPLGRVGAWGAAAGMLVGAFPFTIGESTTEIPLWLLAVVVVGTITLMSALSAVASALVLRRLGRRQTAASAR